MIGVHTPEFSFEKERRNVENAVRDLNVTYPVAIDSEYKIWQAFNNEYWPAHYFVDGKRQLVAEAIEWTSEQVQAHQRGCVATTPSGVIEHFVDLWRQIVTSSGAHAGCPLAALASDPYADEPQLAAAVERGFEAWTALLTDQLGSAGMSGSDALAIATTTVAAMEGALILCRARGNVAPLDAIATQLHQLVTARN